MLEPREAVVGDFDQLMVLYRQLQPQDPVLTDGSDRQVFEQILSREGLYLFVLEAVDGQLLASCYLNVMPNLSRSASPYAVIENVISRESHRGTGCGKRVIGHALEVAWSLGCYKCMLLTGSKQAATHGFYHACGFVGDEKHGYIARPPIGDQAADSP